MRGFSSRSKDAWSISIRSPPQHSCSVAVSGPRHGARRRTFQNSANKKNFARTKSNKSSGNGDDFLSVALPRRRPRTRRSKTKYQPRNVDIICLGGLVLVLLAVIGTMSNKRHVRLSPTILESRGETRREATKDDGVWSSPIPPEDPDESEDFQT
jgi:hypothetical protein